MENPNVPPPASGFDWLTRILIWIAAADEELLRQSPSRDLVNIRAIAWLMVATLLYQTALFSLIGIELFDARGTIWPLIILASLGIATFILLIDRYVVVLSGFHHEGVTELARGGVDTSGGAFARIKLGFFLIVRIAILSVGLAALCGLFVSLLIFSGDIHSRIESQYLQANAGVITNATKVVDAGIERATAAVKDQTARVNALSAQVAAVRQNEIDPSGGDPAIQQTQQEVQKLLDQKDNAAKDLEANQAFAADESGGIKTGPESTGRPGFGPRYRAAMAKAADARARLQAIEKQLNAARTRLDMLRTDASSTKDSVIQRSHDQLPAFEEALKAETAKLTSLKSDLANLIANRERAIRQAVEQASNHVSYDDGFRARLVILEQIAESDTKIAVVIILVDVVSFGLELAAVLARVTGYAPTTFAALLARDVYMAAVHIADEMLTELKTIEDKNSDESGASTTALSDKPLDGSPGATAAPVPPANGGETAQPVQAPKRKRGRPRKHGPLTVITGGNGQEHPGQPPSPRTPA